MNIQDEIKQLKDKLADLESRVVDFEVGDWVVVDAVNQAVRRVVNIDHNRDFPVITNTPSGIVGSWSTNNIARKATPNEIQEALVDEAKRRGLVKKGVKVKTLDGRIPSKWVDDCYRFRYDVAEDSLVVHTFYIYREGTWAEIIEDKAKFFDWDVVKTSSCIDIACNTHSKDYLRNVKRSLEHVKDKTVAEVLTELKKLDL